MVIETDKTEFALPRHSLSSARSQLYKRSIFKKGKDGQPVPIVGKEGSDRNAEPLASGMVPRLLSLQPYACLIYNVAIAKGLLE